VLSSTPYPQKSLSTFTPGIGKLPDPVAEYLSKGFDCQLLINGEKFNASKFSVVIKSGRAVPTFTVEFAATQEVDIKIAHAKPTITGAQPGFMPETVGVIVQGKPSTYPAAITPPAKFLETGSYSSEDLKKDLESGEVLTGAVDKSPLLPLQGYDISGWLYNTTTGMLIPTTPWEEIEIIARPGDVPVEVNIKTANLDYIGSRVNPLSIESIPTLTDEELLALLENEPVRTLTNQAVDPAVFDEITRHLAASANPIEELFKEQEDECLETPSTLKEF
jgi:hypothetical protein